MKTLLTSFLLITIISANAQKNQNESINELTTGNYTVHKVIEKGYKKYFFEVIKKKWPLEFAVSDNKITQVLCKRAGIIDELFKPDLINYPAYFGYKDYRLTYVDGIIYYYKWTPKNKAIIKYAFTKDNKLSSKIDKYKLTLETYMIAMAKQQVGAKSDRKEDKKKLIEQERLANSLQKKSVKKIAFKLETTPENLGMGAFVKYGVIATLTNSTTLTTPNLNGKLPWSDFIIDVTGGTPNQEETTIFNDGSLIPNDQLIVNVKSKFHPTIQFTHTIDLTYNNDITIEHFGSRGSSGSSAGLACADCSSNGGNGSGAYSGVSLIIYVKGATTKKGIAYNKIEVKDESNGKVLHKLKINKANYLTINNSGGRGGYGGSGMADGYNYSASGGRGGDGGDGGKITIIKDANVSSFKYKALNGGGYGGDGGEGDGKYAKKGQNGNSGNKGAVSENIGQVNIKW